MTGKEDKLEHENIRLRRLLTQAGVDAAASDVVNNVQQVLIGELHHRVKNLMAMILAVVTQTMRSARDLPTAQEAVQSRLMALSRSHDLINVTRVDSAPLERLLKNVIEPFAQDGRFTLSIPHVMVFAASPALSISLVINELCTNAIKYGALSTAGGHVDLSGRLNDDTLTLVWTERGGPPVVEPSSLSFGATLIKVALPESEVNLRFMPAGVVCEMRIPLASLK
jgi:two-component sensor histidine kinase